MVETKGVTRAGGLLPLAVAGLAGGLASGHALGQGGLVVFVHDQLNDEILRLVDLNNDGDAHDPGEATVFFDDGPPVTGVDNAQGMVALGPWTLLATDNFEPDNIVRLEDLDQNGDAFGVGEHRVWFSGSLAPGITLGNPSDLRMRSDGRFFLLENGAFDPDHVIGIYILEDLNGDNDVDDPGESTEFFSLSPPDQNLAVPFDVVEDNAGRVYTLDITDPDDIESIDMIDAAGTARNTWLDSAQLFSMTNLVLVSTVAELEHDPGTDEVVFGANTLSNGQRILAARDANGSGGIDTPGEVRLLWSEDTHADGFSTGSPRDFHRTSDGRLLWTDGLADRVMMLTDLNGDGDYNDAGETTVFFDADTAVANGLPGLELPLSITAFEDDVCVADLAEPFGTLNFFDVSAYIAFYNAGDAVADLAEPFGSLNFFDVSAFIAAYNAGCP